MPTERFTPCLHCGRIVHLYYSTNGSTYWRDAEAGIACSSNGNGLHSIVPNLADVAKVEAWLDA